MKITDRLFPRKRRAPFLLASVALLTAAATPARAHMVRLSGDAGATTNLDVADGVGATFAVKGKPGKPKQSLGYLRFDLADLPEGTLSNQVLKATLRVFVNNSTKSGGSFNVLSVEGDWNEDTITGVNAPALGRLPPRACPPARNKP